MIGESVVKEMNTKISVIVPVYNVEKYLERCLESIIFQTYKELEIIVINDGSTDNSGKICDYYAQKDSRIKVLHQENKGAASAKNAGLHIATGKYLTFVDSDDYLEKDSYEFMQKHLEEKAVDVIHCAFRDVYKEHVTDRLLLAEEKKFDVISYLKRFATDWTCSLLWNKMYRREIFNGIFFEEGHKIDDEFFVYQGILNAEKILYIPKIIYNYRRRKSGIMMSEESKEKIILDKIDFISQRRKKIIAKYPELKETFDKQYLEFLLALSKDISITEENLKTIKKLFTAYIKEKEKIKIPISLCIQICKLQCTNNKKIIEKNGKRIQNRNLDIFFD